MLTLRKKNPTKGSNQAGHELNSPATYDSKTGVEVDTPQHLIFKSRVFIPSSALYQ